MAQDDTRPAIGSGTNGGTGGTGPTEAVPEGGDVAQAEREGDGESLASGDDAVETAIGGGSVAGTGGSPELSGRMTSEGTGNGPIAPDPGDPGGMGGVRASARSPDNRPPGGVSPIPKDED